MFALVVRFEVKPESVEAFDELVSRTLAGIREEEGTLLYVTSRVAGSPWSRVFFEIYRDEAAFAAHEQYSHTRRFLEEREPMLESYRVEFLDQVGGKLPVWQQDPPGLSAR